MNVLQLERSRVFIVLETDVYHFEKGTPNSSGHHLILTNQNGTLWIAVIENHSTSMPNWILMKIKWLTS